MSDCANNGNYAVHITVHVLQNHPIIIIVQDLGTYLLRTFSEMYLCSFESWPMFLFVAVCNSLCRSPHNAYMHIQVICRKCRALGKGEILSPDLQFYSKWKKKLIHWYCFMTPSHSLIGGDGEGVEVVDGARSCGIRLVSHICLNYCCKVVW